jgi:siroheme synthase (precorrin-2 oxidase/ferrochelatase)
LCQKIFARSLIVTLDTDSEAAMFSGFEKLVIDSEGDESALERIVFGMAYTSDRTFCATVATSSEALCAPANVPNTK